jgi:hypothetical protein
VGGPDVSSYRSFKHAWNLGHIIAFALWTYLLLMFWDRLVYKTFWGQCLLMLLVTLVLGAAIEVAQYGFRRTPDMGDMMRNVIGALLAVAFFSPERHRVLKVQRHLFQMVLLLAAVLHLGPVALAITDERRALRQFPVLADFETPWEISRWGGDAEFSRDRRYVTAGLFSLKIELNTSTYSGVSLNYFPSDWSDYKSLRMDLFNPNAMVLMVTCRIHDEEHAQHGLQYKDRFNRSFGLKPGWNYISIPLADVAAAPRTRTINLHVIEDLSIFAARLEQPRTVYLDHVRLVP